MTHRTTVLNNAAKAAIKRAEKARARGNEKESSQARKRALRDTRKALQLTEAQKKKLRGGNATLKRVTGSKISAAQAARVRKGGKSGNATIKALTGSQITESEARRLRRQQATDDHQ